MSYDISSLAALLKDNGYSFTQVRKTIFDALYTAESLTMQELTKQLPNVDRASVYRTVELFEKLGIIHRIQIGWKYKLELSDMFREHHHHAICTNCGVTFPIREDESLEIYLQTIGQSYGFNVTTHTLELRGLCSQCSLGKRAASLV